MSKRGFPITRHMREVRRKEAQERQAEYDKLTLEQKLARLPADGCKKQRARLLAQLARSKSVSKQPDVVATEPTQEALPTTEAEQPHHKKSKGK